MEKPLSYLCESLGYEFKDIQLLKEAVTHRSFSAEYKIDYDNQRLEFLGDAVVEIIITNMLYRRYTEEPEGVLTKIRAALARQESLAEIAREIELSEYLRLGRGEKAAAGFNRDSTLCDAFEAVAGAVYLDGGYEAAEQVLKPLFMKVFPEPHELLSNINPKGKLQEFIQREGSSAAPKYHIENKEGPDHDCMFTVSVTINGEKVAEGKGRNRKLAEMQAARKALEVLSS